jgi:quercetin dioxygenase-like cupin family protein
MNLDNNTFQKGTIYDFKNSVVYADGSIVSKTVLKNSAGNISLFAFDKGQGLSEHTAPFEAIVQILDGEAEVIINSIPHFLKTGESIIMPANIPHALKANVRFKMQLLMIKGS